jgi:hypothetical protein
MKWDEVKAKAGSMTKDGSDALSQLFESKSALFESRAKVNEALSMAEEELKKYE